jgi:hypothetical protein
MKKETSVRQSNENEKSLHNKFAVYICNLIDSAVKRVVRDKGGQVIHRFIWNTKIHCPL